MLSRYKVFHAHSQTKIQFEIPARRFGRALADVKVNLCALGKKTATTWRYFKARSLRRDDSSYTETYGKNQTLTHSSKHTEYYDTKFVKIFITFIPKSKEMDVAHKMCV